MSTFHERTAELIKLQEQKLGRPLTLDEQDALKQQAFQEMFMRAAQEAATEADKPAKP